MESQGETPYPVYFFDGEQHLDLGHVGIHPGSQFKVLQSTLSQKTGLSPNQISAVLVCRKGAKPSEKHQKKLPINENTNFAAIVTHHNPRKDKSCFLLVSIRRSRRDRERRGRSRRSAADDDGSGSSRDDLSPPSNPYAHRLSFPEKTILRRDPTAGGLLDLAALRRIYSPAMDGLLGAVQDNGLLGAVQDNGLLGAVQDNGLRFGSYGPRSLPMYAFENAYPYAYGLHSERAVRVAAVVCEICSGATDGRAVPFHPCVYDEVLEEGRGPSPAGPIERPGKAGRIELTA